MTFVTCDLPEVLGDLERAIAAPRRPGEPVDEETSTALDVLYHALVFTAHPDGLAIWRAAIRTGAVDDEARSALRAMLSYLNDAVEQGESHRVTEICDCLEDLMSGDPRPHVGGIPTQA